jgi:hypothetical protein
MCRLTALQAADEEPGARGMTVLDPSSGGELPPSVHQVHHKKFPAANKNQELSQPESQHLSHIQQNPRFGLEIWNLHLSRSAKKSSGDFCRL